MNPRTEAKLKELFDTMVPGHDAVIVDWDVTCRRCGKTWITRIPLTPPPGPHFVLAGRQQGQHEDCEHQP